MCHEGAHKPCVPASRDTGCRDDKPPPPAKGEVADVPLYLTLYNDKAQVRGAARRARSSLLTRPVQCSSVQDMSPAVHLVMAAQAGSQNEERP